MCLCQADIHKELTPPEPVTVTVPSLPPKQETSVWDVIDPLTADEGSPTFTARDAEQLFASVIITEYGPAGTFRISSVNGSVIPYE